MNSIANVMKGLNYQFYGYTNDIDYKLRITNQKIYLEHHLNNQFDLILRRIFIQNHEVREYDYVFTRLESLPTYIFLNSESATPYYLNTTATQNSQVNYIVFVHNSIIFDEDVMKAEINKYNPVGKIYDIQTW